LVSTPDFVFVHLNKSGGTFVNNVLRELYGTKAETLGYHLPYRYIPEGYGTLPVLGVVRNPWDYYVSLYHFQKQSRNTNFLFDIFSEGGRLDFSETLKNMLDPKDELFDQMFDLAPIHFQSFGANLTKSCVGELSCLQGGWYSRLYQRLYRGSTPHMLRQEKLREDLNDFLLAISSHYFDNRQLKRIFTMENVNVSRHRHYSSYYTPETLEIVNSYDELIVNKYQYNFEET